MAIRERVSHQIVHGKWDDMIEVEKGWFAIEQEIGGFPMKRASQPIAGRDGMSVSNKQKEIVKFLPLLHR